jgi:hypothetical protein
MASASPPLFPGPAKIFTGESFFHIDMNLLANAHDALSIRSVELMGSFSIVYASASLICAAERIFMDANLGKCVYYSILNRYKVKFI